MTPLKHLTTPLAVAAAVLGLALAGCGDSAPTAGSASADGSGAAAPPTATLRTISGQQKVTPTGEVPVGETATFKGVVYEGGKSLDVPLRVGISAITKGSQADFAGFDLDDDAKGATPYYVKASFRNLAADRSWDPTGMPGALVAKSESGKPVGRLTLIGDFPKCQDDRPKTLGPGETVRTCTIYLVPNGDALTSVSHGDADANDYVWKAG